jgi:hypothetical protein
MCAGGHQTTQFFRLKVLAPYRFLCKMSFHVDWGHEVDTKAGVVYHILSVECWCGGELIMQKSLLVNYEATFLVLISLLL